MNDQQTAHYLANRYPSRLVIISECPHGGKKKKHHPDYKKPYEVELLCNLCHLSNRKHDHNKGIFCQRRNETLRRSECAGYRFLEMPFCFGCNQTAKGVMPARRIAAILGIKDKTLVE